MSFSAHHLPPRLFRLSRNNDPTKLTEWRHLATAEPGRWSDPEAEYRVLYASDTEVGAYVEVLQDLRPHPSSLELLDAIEDDGHFGILLPTVESAARERLRQYHFAALIPREGDFIVDVASPASRTEIETRMRDDLGGQRVKIGDFNGGNRDFTRRVSRLVFTAAVDGDREAAGVAARSAEHEPTMCFAYFETGRETEELRGGLFLHFVRQALDEHNFLRAALAYITA